MNILINGDGNAAGKNVMVTDTTGTNAMGLIVIG
jgi:hypothetical protein